MAILDSLNIITTLVGGFLGAGITWFYSSRQTKHIETQMYLSLEMASIELFRFEADHLDIVASFRGDDGQFLKQLPAEEYAGLVSYMTQLLNLMEMAVTFRNDGLFPPKVFATWVAWMYEISTSPTFQANWSSEFRKHYSEELAEIIDMGVSVLKPGSKLDEKEPISHFYGHVATRFNDCPYIKAWASR